MEIDRISKRLSDYAFCAEEEFLLGTSSSAQAAKAQESFSMSKLDRQMKELMLNQFMKPVIYEDPNMVVWYQAPKRWRRRKSHPPYRKTPILKLYSEPDPRVLEIVGKNIYVCHPAVAAGIRAELGQ